MGGEEGAGAAAAAAARLGKRAEATLEEAAAGFSFRSFGMEAAGFFFSKMDMRSLIEDILASTTAAASRR